jgi:hypothetical protein
MLLSNIVPHKLRCAGVNIRNSISLFYPITSRTGLRLKWVGRRSHRNKTGSVLNVQITSAVLLWRVYGILWIHPFTSLSKLGFIINECSMKLELSDKGYWKCLLSNFNKLSAKLYLIHTKGNLQSYVYLALLWINVLENGNGAAILSMSYLVSARYVENFVGSIEIFIHRFT